MRSDALTQMSILEEIAAATAIQDVIKGHPMYLSVAIQYIKSKQTTYIRDTLKTVIQEVVAMEDLDLETDPIAVDILIPKLTQQPLMVASVDL